MSGDGLADYLDHWRAVDPQHAAAWQFLRPDERIRVVALVALEGEWLKAVRNVREPQVTAVKLGWWREEVARAAVGDARHPLTRALFVDPGVRGVPVRYWNAAVDAALLGLNAAPAADFEAQLAAARPLARGFAELETRVWFGAEADPARATEVTCVGHLVADLRAMDAVVGSGRVPVPMHLLARHGLSIASLAADGPARRQLVREAAQDLGRVLLEASAMPGPLGFIRDLAARHDLATLALAARAQRPLVALRASRHGLRSLLKTWQAARRWRVATSSTRSHA